MKIIETQKTKQLNVMKENHKECHTKCHPSSINDEPTCPFSDEKNTTCVIINDVLWYYISYL